MGHRVSVLAPVSLLATAALVTIASGDTSTSCFVVSKLNKHKVPTGNPSADKKYHSVVGSLAFCDERRLASDTTTTTTTTNLNNSVLPIRHLPQRKRKISSPPSSPVPPVANSDVFIQNRNQMHQERKWSKIRKLRLRRFTRRNKREDFNLASSSDDIIDTTSCRSPAHLDEEEEAVVVSKDLFASEQQQQTALLSQKHDFQNMSQEDLRKWACATDVNTLRSMFGTNHNKLWGDLDNQTARKLYHSLLPRALYALYQQGLAPSELAPLAFEARKAAKEYARERSHVPGRMMAIAYDGFRHLKSHGSWSSKGLSWNEIWSKYEQQVKEEIEDIFHKGQAECADLSSLICLKILERSCVTNEHVDRLLLKQEPSHNKSKGSDVVDLASRFEQDVREVLERKGRNRISAHDVFLLRLLVLTKRKLLVLQQRTALTGEDSENLKINLNGQVFVAPNITLPFATREGGQQKIWEIRDTVAPAA